MFDTERFLVEIQSRECLWDTKIKAYSDKYTRRRAWEDIAKLFNPDWVIFTPEHQDKQINEYIKKWKNLKDYYYKCKNPGKNGSVGGRKKKPNYFEFLSFLDVVKEPRDTSSNVDSPGETENLEDEMNDTSQNLHNLEGDAQFPDTPTPTSYRKKMTPFQRTLIDMLQMRGGQNEEFNGNKYFLLSLLPEMDRMTEDENLEFRVSVLNILKDIRSKFKNDTSVMQNNIFSGCEVQNNPAVKPPTSQNTGYTTQNNVRGQHIQKTADLYPGCSYHYNDPHSDDNDSACEERQNNGKRKERKRKC